MNKVPELAPLIHQAALDPHLNLDQLNEICDSVKHFNFEGLCTNLNFISTAKERIGTKSKIKLIAVIAFPFGSIPISLKRAEAEWAISHGADELDIVPNFSALKEGNITIFAEEIAILCSLGAPVRVILDIAKLTSEELNTAIEASIDAGANSIQSGNGFGPTISKNEIKNVVRIAKNRCSIKVVGGIKTLEHALDLIEAGASTLGTSYGSALMMSLKKK